MDTEKDKALAALCNVDDSDAKVKAFFGLTK
jgi:hypothetical protein